VRSLENIRKTLPESNGSRIARGNHIILLAMTSCQCAAWQEFAGKLPLPLGEGWGEGLAMERPPTFIFYLFPDRTEEAKEERVLFPVTQLGPHPTLSQREGFTHNGLAPCLVRE